MHHLVSALQIGTDVITDVELIAKQALDLQSNLSSDVPSHHYLMLQLTTSLIEMLLEVDLMVSTRTGDFMILAIRYDGSSADPKPVALKPTAFSFQPS